MGRTRLNDRLSNTLGDFVFGSNSVGSGSRLYSNGIFQAAYSRHMTGAWSGTVTYAQEGFLNVGNQTSWLIGIRKAHQNTVNRTDYWGISLGRSSMTYDVDRHESENYAWQLDLGMRWNKGPLFVFADFGLGDVGAVSTGIGTQF